MTQIYLADDESEPFIYLMESVNLNGCPLTNTDVTVEQYMQFAARDLEDASERGAVNALGNIKRALHQTVDTLLQGYGLLARNRRLSFCAETRADRHRRALLAVDSQDSQQ